MVSVQAHLPHTRSGDFSCFTWFDFHGTLPLRLLGADAFVFLLSHTEACGSSSDTRLWGRGTVDGRAPGTQHRWLLAQPRFWLPVTLDKLLPLRVKTLHLKNAGCGRSNDQVSFNGFQALINLTGTILNIITQEFGWWTVGVDVGNYHHTRKCRLSVSCPKKFIDGLKLGLFPNSNKTVYVEGGMQPIRMAGAIWFPDSEEFESIA